MLALDDKYYDIIEAIAGEIQASAHLQDYLEEEEESHYLLLKETYEPKLADVYHEVAINDPLQLVSLEKTLLNEVFEGLYLPKILGYSVLRGGVNDRYKYELPQEHFKEVLLAICNSANFDILRKRIGQSIQMGFALSSDIWVTNLIEEVTNKRVKHFLKTQKQDSHRNPEVRKTNLLRYTRQFKTEEFLSTDFPKNKAEFQVLFPSIKRFLIQRIKKHYNNESLIQHLKTLIENDDFQTMPEHLQILGLYAFYFETDDDGHVKKVFNKVRKENPGFSHYWFKFVLELHRSELNLGASEDQRVFELVDEKVEDKLVGFYKLMNVLHSKGYIHEDTQDAIKNYYITHEGLSVENECLRESIFSYFKRVLNNIDVTEYAELFELSKYYAIYIEIFGNQQFNQNVKDLSMKYVRKLLKHYTDKRGKDYQDIKKFVSSTFVSLGFLNNKQVVELFKTRRKRKPTQA